MSFINTLHKLLFSLLIIPWFLTEATATPPDWSVNPSDYQNSASATGLLYLNGEETGSENILSAFVGEECRGVVSPVYTLGHWMYFLTIYANTSGETIQFKTWIASLDTVLDLTETIEFIINETYGSPTDPFEWNSYHNYDFAPAVAGIPDQTIEDGDSFQSFDLDDYLTTQDSDPIIWSYSGASNLTVAIDGNNSVTVSPTVSGWIGSEDIIFTAADSSDNGYSDADTVSFTILPFDNPPSIENFPDQTIELGSTFEPIQLTDNLTELDGDSVVWSYNFIQPFEPDSLPGWSMNPADFEMTMNLVAKVISRSEDALGDSHTLAAFVDGECRGTASAIQFANEWHYYLTIYSNTNDEEISFRFYDSDFGQNLPVYETVTFESNATLGSPNSPHELQAGLFLIDISSSAVATIQQVDNSWTGSTDILLIVSDTGTLHNYSDTAQVSISVINDTPVITTIPAQTILEGGSFTTVSLDDYVSDYGTSDANMTWSVTGEDTLTVSVENRILTVSAPSDDWFGSKTLSVTATDSDPNDPKSATVTVDYTITPVNDPPAFTLSGDLTVEEDFTTTETVTVTPDVLPYGEEGQVVTYSLTPSSVDFAAISFSSSDGTVTFTDVENEYGSQQFTVTANDNQVENSTYQQAFTFTVNAVNDAPTIDLPEGFLFLSDSLPQTVDLSPYVADMENDPLTLEVSSYEDSLSATVIDFEVTFNTTGGWIGTDSVQVTVIDSSLESSDVMAVTIRLENNNPVITLPDTLSFYEDTSASYDFSPYLSDADGDAVGLTVSGNENISVIINGSTVTMSASADWYGEETMIFTVSDGTGSSADTVVVHINGINDPPSFSLSGNVTKYEDFVTTETVMVTPEDISYGEEDQTVAYSLSPEAVGFANVSIDANTGTVTITAVENMNGSQEFIVTADDGQSENNLTAQTFTLSVFAVNDPPDFAISGDVTIDEDFSTTEMVTVTPAAVPADELEQTVTYSISPTSVDFATAQFDTATGSVTITSLEDVYGSQEFTITADDGEEENFTATQTFTLTVNPVNDAPAFTLSGDVTVDEDFTSAETVIVTPAEIPFGEEDQTVTYSLTPASVTFAAVSIDTSTGEIAFTAAADSNGSQEFTVVADDGEAANNTYEQTFILTVNALNDAPVVADVEMEVEEDTSAPIPFAGSDVDDDSLTYFVVEPPTYGTVENGIYTPPPNFYSTDVFTYQATDGNVGSNIGTVTVIVDMDNDPPVAQSRNVTTNEETPVVITLEGSDPESDSLTFALVSDAVHGTLALSDEEVTYTPELNYVGLDSFTFIASDGELDSDPATVSIMINAINDAPVVVEPLPDVTIDEDDFGAVIIASLENFFVEVDAGDDLSFTGEALDDGLDSLIIGSFSINNSLTSVFHYGGRDIITVKRSVLQSLQAERVGGADLFRSSRSQEGKKYQMSLSLSADVSSWDDIMSSSDSTMVIVYPTENFVGDIRITVTGSDDMGESATDTLLLTVESINDVPSADAQEVITDEDTPLAITLTGSDVEDSTLTFTVVDVPGHGIYEDGIYTPAENYNGSDSFTFIANDGELDSEPSIVNIIVNPVNDPPVADALSDTTDEDSPVTLELTGSDLDGDDLTFSIVDSTVHGSLSGILPVLTYTPEADYLGTDSLTFSVSDDTFSDTAVVLLTVNSLNDIPVADAGEDQMVISRMTVTLDGSGSFDVEESELTYNWSSHEGLELTTDGFTASFNAPEEEGSYLFTLTVNDGELDSEPDITTVTVMPATTLDSLPDYTDTPPEEGDSIGVEYTFPGFFNADSATLYYMEGGSSFEGTSMESGSGFNRTISGTFSAVIPGDVTSYNGVAYYIEAVDINSNTLITDTVSIPVQIPDGEITSRMSDSLYKDGIPREVWRMVSVPSDLEDASVASTFDAALGSSGEYDWRLYEWDGSGWSEPSVLTSGQGYWLNQWMTDSASFDLGSGHSSDLTGTSVELLPGWNLISSPYLFPVRVDIDSSLFTGLYSYGNYGGEGWNPDLTNEFEPWGAYAIFNRTEENQIFDIDPLNQPEESGFRARLTGNTEGWTLRLDMAGDAYADRGTIIGRNAAADEELDAFDLPKPLSPGDYISLCIIQPEWKQGLRKLAREFRSLDEVNGSWDLELDVRGNHGELKVSTELAGQFPSDCEIVVVDCISGDTYNIQQSSMFTIKHYSEDYSRSYTVIAGEPDYVRGRVAEIQALIPQEFALSQNYPNPFNPTTTIEYSVAVPGKVQIVIYDLLGREVKTVVNRFHEVGYRHVEWNGRDNNGVPAATGIYICQMSAQGVSKVRKMILIK